MTGYLRRAGAGFLPDGAELVWSVADGTRGRRWRAVASRGGAISHVLLLEVDPTGRPSRLELTTPAGMLTLHPGEGSRTLHGNVVTASGVRHLRLPWSPDHGLEVEGRPIAWAVTAHRLAISTAAGEGRTVVVVGVSRDLEVATATRRFIRLGEEEWRIEAPSGEVEPVTIRVDERGVPRLIGDVREWALELD